MRRASFAPGARSCSSRAADTLSRTTFRVTRVKPKNDTEKRVYEALSGDNWGASSTTLNEIAQDTFD